MQKMRVENDQSHSRGLPRLHGHVHGGGHHPSLLHHRRGAGLQHATGELSDLVADSHPRRRAALLETTLQPVRTPSDLPPVSALQSRV